MQTPELLSLSLAPGLVRAELLPAWVHWQDVQVHRAADPHPVPGHVLQLQTRRSTSGSYCRDKDVSVGR